MIDDRLSLRIKARHPAQPPGVGVGGECSQYVGLGNAKWSRRPHWGPRGIGSHGDALTAREHKALWFRTEVGQWKGVGDRHRRWPQQGRSDRLEAHRTERADFIDQIEPLLQQRGLQILPKLSLRDRAGIGWRRNLGSALTHCLLLSNAARQDRVPRSGVRALRSTRLPAGRAGTFRLPRWAA